MKRVREGEGDGEWRDAGPRRKQKAKPKVVTGTADLSEFGDLAGPAQFWIGNTHPTTDAGTLERVLTKCAEDLSVADFKVDDIHCLTKDDNPRSRSWKITVPARLSDAMMNPAMYYKGWSHRVFTPRTGVWKQPVAAAADPVSGGGSGETLSPHP